MNNCTTHIRARNLVSSPFRILSAAIPALYSGLQMPRVASGARCQRAWRIWREIRRRGRHVRWEQSKLSSQIPVVLFDQPYRDLVALAYQLGRNCDIVRMHYPHIQRDMAKGEVNNSALWSRWLLFQLISSPSLLLSAHSSAWLFLV